MNKLLTETQPPPSHLDSYGINEIFYSLQGEGIRTGEPSIFIRFQNCNLRCQVKTHGFDCDTEFASGVPRSSSEILQQIDALSARCEWIVLTGGEPSLQLNQGLIQALKNRGFRLAIETNGTREVPEGIDWITVSPKVAEHAIRQKTAHEVKYVRSHGMQIPRTVVQASYYLISPAFEGDHVPKQNLDWCVQLCKDNPPWRLSLQTHKILGIR